MPPPEASALADLPTHTGLPWLGAPWAMLSHPGQYLLDGYRRLGPAFRVHLVGMEMVALLGPDANRAILVTHRQRFSHAEGYAFVRTVLGDGLLFQDGEVHRRNRQLMMPAFNQRAVNSYFDVMLACVERHAARWAGAGTGRMYDRLRHLTFELMARLVLGLEGDLALERLSRLNDDLAKGSTAVVRVGTPWTNYGRGLRARDELRRYLRGVIERRRDAPGTDALGLLMAARDEHGRALGDDDLLEQAVILMFAGHETTTSMLSSLLSALHQHPETLAALRAEIRREIGNEPITLDGVQRLALLDLVLMEVERLWPPISLCQRGVVEAVDVLGHRLPPGTLVLYSPWVTHRLPDVFDDPDRFDPLRFAAPREEHKRTPYGLVGFGGGPRLCIGQAFALLEMKIVAAVLLRDYDVALEPVDPRPLHVPTLHPRSGLPARVARRAGA
jgi:cytochrome P450